MTSKAALLALLTLWGVGAAVPHQAWADEITSEQAADSDSDPGKVPPLTDRVWVKAGETSGLPGVIVRARASGGQNMMRGMSNQGGGLHTGTFAVIGGRRYVFAARNPGPSGASPPALVIFDVTDVTP